MLPRPEGVQPHYGEHLGDVHYWEPYVREVVGRHDLPHASIEAGFVGTFPTFLVGDVVVKLFGPLFDGRETFEIECEVHAAIAEVESIPAPAIVGCGSLFDSGESWPYLVQERVGGVALRDAAVGAGQRAELASDLAHAVRALHELPTPTFRPNLLRELRSRRGPFLPDALRAEVDGFIDDALPADTFVHGDITEDHVFVDGSRLVAIIDWGDALPADPFYDLVPIFFDAFRRDRSAADAFLASYGWPVDGDFTRRLLQAMIEFQFNPFGGIDMAGVARVEDLADRLWSG